MTDSIDNRSIAVLRKRLPYTDRRSLSQAWFSALHLAQIVPARGLPGRRATDPSFRAPSARAGAAALAAERAEVSAGTSRAVKVRGDVREGETIGRVRDASRPAKKKAAFEEARSYPPFSTSLTIGSRHARIKLLLRREGPTLHVIALCAPESVDLVRRALECADAYLRQNGESVRACVRSLAETTR